ncbi:unnamed protein product [Sympodiomycopsis kandeliae]
MPTFAEKLLQNISNAQQPVRATERPKVTEEKTQDWPTLQAANPIRSQQPAKENKTKNNTEQENKVKNTNISLPTGVSYDTYIRRRVQQKEFSGDSFICSPEESVASPSPCNSAASSTVSLPTSLEDHDLTSKSDHASSSREKETLSFAAAAAASPKTSVQMNADQDRSVKEYLVLEKSSVRQQQQQPIPSSANFLSRIQSPSTPAPTSTVTVGEILFRRPLSTPAQQATMQHSVAQQTPTQTAQVHESTVQQPQLQPQVQQPRVQQQPMQSTQSTINPSLRQASWAPPLAGRPSAPLTPPGLTIQSRPMAQGSAPDQQNPIRATSRPVSHAVDRPLDPYATGFLPNWLRQVNTDSNYTHIPLPASESISTVDYEDYALHVWPQPLWQAWQDGRLSHDDDDANVFDTNATRLPEDTTHDVSASLQVEGEETFDGDLAGLASTRTAAFDPTPLEEYNSSGPSLPLADDSVVRHLHTLTPFTYAKHWKPLLDSESKHREEELASYTMYSQSLEFFNYSPEHSQRNGLFILTVPGVREERPQLFAGDRLFLRPLAAAHPNDPAQNPGWLHIQLEARVRAVRTLQSHVIIECPQLDELIRRMIISLTFTKFNIIFAYDPRAFLEDIKATELLSHKMIRKGRSAKVLSKWLFPTREDAEKEVKKMGDFQALDWYDTGLNPEQQAAVASIVLHKRDIPYLLSGPPGTGKTKTSVEAVMQILSRNPQARVLVVAPSNAACDVFALRLASRLSPTELFRLNHPSRTFAEVPEALNMYTHVDETKNVFGLPPWKSLMRAKVVVTACQDVPLLNHSRVANNTDLGELQDQFLSGFKQAADSGVSLHWTHLLVDEAGQATEPDLTPALACVLPHYKCQEVPGIILVGDVKQLGPSIRSAACRSHELDVSLLERLSGRGAYRRSLIELRQFGRNVVASIGQETSPVAADFVSCGHLIRNYRARHPALLHLPSNLFYGDSLVPSSLPTARSLQLLSWSGLPNSGVEKGQPMLFADVRTRDDWVHEGVSWYNLGEASKIVEICQNLMRDNPDLKPEEISVISPFREQVWRIRVLLRQVLLSGVRVGPVEAFQGQESPVVILSPVRSSARFIDRDRETSSGLMSESKRLNVAITRARELLIIVGNAEVLSDCGDWRSIIGHAKRNGWMRPWDSKEFSKFPKSSSAASISEDNLDACRSPISTSQISALECAERGDEGWWKLMLSIHKAQ